MSFPEGLPEKKGKLGRSHQRQQPGKAYDAERLAGGPGAADTAQQRASRNPAASKRVMSQGSRFGLRSKSETMYPEAYRPVDEAFWQGLSSQQQYEVLRLQAVAQEKVGFERGTKKFFIDTAELEPDSRGSTPVDLVALATPRLVFGGVLIGAGLLLGVLGLSPVLSDIGWAALGGIGALIGIFTVAFGQN